jgi:hypothetical protein
MLGRQVLFLDRVIGFPLGKCKESTLMFCAMCTNVAGFSSSCGPVFIRAGLSCQKCHDSNHTLMDATSDLTWLCFAASFASTLT